MKSLGSLLTATHGVMFVREPAHHPWYLTHYSAEFMSCTLVDNAGPQTCSYVYTVHFQHWEKKWTPVAKIKKFESSPSPLVFQWVSYYFNVRSALKTDPKHCCSVCSALPSLCPQHAGSKVVFLRLFPGDRSAFCWDSYLIQSVHSFLELSEADSGVIHQNVQSGECRSRPVLALRGQPLAEAWSRG